MLLKIFGEYDRVVKDWDNTTAAQKTWARFKTYSITAYHKTKKKREGQVKNMIKGEIPALISDDI